MSMPRLTVGELRTPDVDQIALLKDLKKAVQESREKESWKKAVSAKIDSLIQLEGDDKVSNSLISFFRSFFETAKQFDSLEKTYQLTIGDINKLTKFSEDKVESLVVGKFKEYESMAGGLEACLPDLNSLKEKLLNMQAVLDSPKFNKNIKKLPKLIKMYAKAKEELDNAISGEKFGNSFVVLPLNQVNQYYAMHVEELSGFASKKYLEEINSYASVLADHISSISNAVAVHATKFNQIKVLRQRALEEAARRQKASQNPMTMWQTKENAQPSAGAAQVSNEQRAVRGFTQVYS